MATVEFRNVQKSFGDVEVIEDLNLFINDGEFVALLGPSGCGKSTSLFMLAGIYLPTGGEILFDGYRVNEVEARNRNVGIVFQSYALYPHMSVRDNICFPLRFKKVASAEVDSRVREASELVQIGELLDRRPSQLSGGQQQRVALARALVKDPTLLLLDEPLSNLDASLRLSMRTEIKILQERLGVTTVLVTHDQIEATTMADRIICMREGSIEQIGTADDLYLRPSSLFVASFIGSPPINLIEGIVADGSLQIGDMTLGVRDAEPGAVVVGPASGTPPIQRFRPGGAHHADRTHGPRDPVCRGFEHRDRPCPGSGLHRRSSHRRTGETGVLRREFPRLPARHRYPHG